MIAPTVLRIVEIISFPEGHNKHIEVTEGKRTVMAILTTRGGGGREGGVARTGKIMYSQIGWISSRGHLPPLGNIRIIFVKCIQN